MSEQPQDDDLLAEVRTAVSAAIGTLALAQAIMETDAQRYAYETAMNTLIATAEHLARVDAMIADAEPQPLHPKEPSTMGAIEDPACQHLDLIEAVALGTVAYFCRDCGDPVEVPGD